MNRIIGREQELNMLQEYTGSGKGEFIALFGRRRVGKTSLIRYFFQDKFDFFATGILDGNKKDQEDVFYDALKQSGYSGTKPQNWKEAFDALGTILERKKRKKRCVVFIDELPCFDTEHSGFVKHFGDFWNRKASWYDNLVLIVCGSATSWMIHNIIDNKGGLHNRITHEMHLRPFNLYQTEQYLSFRGGKWDRLSILQLYMALGGIPYYYSLLNIHKSASENIDALFFEHDAPLRNEYHRLFKSLYRNPDRYLDIVEMLAKNKQGLSRNEIAEKLGIKSGRSLTLWLENLIQCDLVSLSSNSGKKNSGIYRLTDFYCHFYLTFCNGTISDKSYWKHTINTPMQNTWYGLAFERVCLFHIEEIIQALHLDSILTYYYSWRSRKTSPGAQIDLIIDRADGIVTLCEMKYSRGDYKQDADESRQLANRISDFMEETKIRKAVQTTLITTYGLQKNLHADDYQRILTLNDLFIITDK